jgi:hypothetical protein
MSKQLDKAHEICEAQELEILHLLDLIEVLSTAADHALLDDLEQYGEHTWDEVQDAVQQARALFRGGR